MIVKANLAHVEYVLNHLSEQNQSELDHMMLTRWEILRRSKDFLKHGVTYTRMDDGVPSFIFGILLESENSTWFIATEAYFALGAAAVIHARRFLRDMNAQFGKLVTGSASQHPDIDRWFSVLGYRKLDEADGVKWFLYG